MAYFFTKAEAILKHTCSVLAAAPRAYLFWRKGLLAIRENRKLFRRFIGADQGVRRI